MKSDMPKLIFTQPEFAAQSCELPEGRTRVGRSSHCDLVIRDDSVSADHCEILVSWNEVIVREHGSKNGTWVAGRRVTGQLPVNHGQTIRFGRVETRVELPEPSLEDTTQNTTHLLRQQAAWTEPIATPFHAVVEPEAGRLPAETTDSGTIIVPAPAAKLPLVPPATVADVVTSATAKGGKLVPWGLVLATAGAVLAGVWLLGGGN